MENQASHAMADSTTDAEEVQVEPPMSILKQALTRTDGQGAAAVAAQIFEVNGVTSDGSEMTLQQFLDYFKNDHNLKINRISKGVWTLYSNNVAKDTEERLNLPMSELVHSRSLPIQGVDMRPIKVQFTCENDTVFKAYDVLYLF